MKMCLYVEENSFVFSMMEGELVVRLEERRRVLPV